MKTWAKQLEEMLLYADKDAIENIISTLCPYHVFKGNSPLLNAEPCCKLCNECWNSCNNKCVCEIKKGGEQDATD